MSKIITKVFYIFLFVSSLSRVPSGFKLRSLGSESRVLTNTPWASLMAHMVKKKSAYNVEDPDLIPGLERSPGEGKGYPLQYSRLENSMHREALEATVH